MNQEKPRKKQLLSELFLEHGRIPPQAVDLEEAVLGGLLISQSEECKMVITIMKPEIFYKEAHQVIASAMRTMFNTEIPIDILTVVEQLRKTGELDLVGGPYYISMLTNRVSSIVNIEYHFRILYQKYIQREVIHICSDAVKDGYEDMTDCFTLLENTVNQLDQLDPKLAERVATTARRLAEEMEKDFIGYKEYAQGSGIIIPQMTYNLGWPRFDEVVTIGRDKIVMVAGASGAGKSKFSRAIAFILLKKYTDIAIQWVSLEDSRQDILRAYLAFNLFISAKYIKMRKFSKEMLDPMMEKFQEFKEFDVEFIDESIKSQDIIHNFVRFCNKRPDKFNILIVDNMLSLDDKQDFKHNQNEMDNYILHNMLKCRQKTKGMILLLHHFNDAQQDKENLKNGYRPVTKDMKGSEGFRRVANQVLLVNSFNIYKDLMGQYQGDDRKILKKMFVVDTGKNREDGISDDVALIHFLQNMAYDQFHEIPIPVQKEEYVPRTERDIPF